MLRFQDITPNIGGPLSIQSIWARHKLQHQIDHDAVQAPNYPYPLKAPPVAGAPIAALEHSYRRRRT